MAQTYETTLKCPKCGKKGVVSWEDDPTRLEQAGTNLKSLSKGFRPGIGYKPTIYCDSCNAPVAN
jgi:hypothetical protein